MRSKVHGVTFQNAKFRLESYFDFSPLYWLRTPISGYRGSSGKGVKLTTHLILVPNLRMNGATRHLHHTPLWRPHEQIYLFSKKSI